VAITSLSITRVSPVAVQLSFASSLADPTFYIWRDGSLIATTTASTYLDMVPVGACPIYDVFDDAADEPSEVYPAYLHLQWRAVDNADYYRVERHNGSQWVEQVRITDDGRAGYYHWYSPRLEDDTTHQFRVVAVTDDGTESTALTLSALMVRHPDPVAVSLSYDSQTQKLTISEA